MNTVSTLHTVRTIPIRQLAWMGQGRALIDRACARIAERDTGLDSPSALPGRTRADVLAHLARGAEAFIALAREAADERPVDSAAERPDDVAAWARAAAARLDQVTVALPTTAWLHPVTFAPGHVGPFRDVAWLQAWEALVHAVDLDAGFSFADLPPDFCHDLLDHTAAARSGTDGPALLLVAPGVGTWTVTGRGATTPVVGSLPDLARWLVGRGSGGVTPVGAGLDLPALPAKARSGHAAGWRRCCHPSLA